MKNISRHWLTAMVALTWHSLSAQMPGFAWVNKFDVEAADWDIGHQVTTDAQGNTVVLGSYKGLMKINTIAGEFELESKNRHTGYLAKWNAQHELLWAIQLPAKDEYWYDNKYRMAMDSEGNLLISSMFENTIDADPGPGDFKLTSTGLKDVLVLKLDSNGQFLWAVNVGNFNTETIKSLACDKDNNVVVTGNFIGTVDFDPSVAVDAMVSTGTSSLFVWKLDANGNHLWVKTAIQNQNAESFETTTDFEGNVLVFGSFSGTKDLDPGPGTAIFSAVFSKDYFIQKLTGGGDLIWVKTFGNAVDNRYGNIVSDAEGNIYTIASFRGMADFDPGPDILNLTSVGDMDVFVQKWNAFGECLWARSFGGWAGDNGTGLALDNMGNVYTTGYYYYEADFDPGPDTVKLSNYSSEDCFIQKLDNDGQFQWVRNLGGYGYDRAFDIAVTVQGDIVSTGWFSGNVDLDPGAGTQWQFAGGDGDMYLQQLDRDGNFVWATAMGSKGGQVTAKDISTDHAGNIISCGVFEGEMDADPGDALLRLVAQGRMNGYIQKLSPEGNLLWAGAIEGTAGAVATDASGNILVAGSFNGADDLDPDPDAVWQNGNNEGGWFLSKLSPDGGLVWVKTFTGPGTAGIADIHLDGLNNIYMAGNYNVMIDCDPGPGVHTLEASGIYDLAIVKLDKDGNYLWSNTTGGTEVVNASSVVTDFHGNVFVAGKFSGEVDFDPGAGVASYESTNKYDFFFEKYDVDGKFLWEKVFQCDSFYNTDPVLLYGGTSGLFMGCGFGSTLDVDPGPATHYFTSSGASDILLLNTTLDGEFIKAVQIGGYLNDNITSLGIDNRGNLYAMGRFSNTVDFDPSSQSVYLESDGHHHFLLALDPSLALKWAGTFGSALGSKMTFDLHNNLVFFSNFYGEVDCNPGPDVDSISTPKPSLSSYIVKLAKYAPVITADQAPYAWPNPTTGPLTIDFGEPIGQVDVTVSGSDGREVMHWHFENTQRPDLPLHTLANGVYFVNISGDNGLWKTIKVVKN